MVGSDANSGSGPQQQGELAVHVVGAVSKPGVYRLAAGARVEEAVKMAGPLPEADLNRLNLAAPLIDGQQVIVPKAGESLASNGISPGAPGNAGSAAGPSPAGAGASPASGKVNINTASAQELDKLPGIGPTLAQRIVDYRSQHGPFRSPEDIKNVSGIGDSRYDQIKDLISVY
ncbi:MAG: ComEA family DNA-binding protein [Clostridia bacterium]|nr:ComEA family DNA-binding protein [Clostridia bacterium]